MSASTGTPQPLNTRQDFVRLTNPIAPESLINLNGQDNKNKSRTWCEVPDSSITSAGCYLADTDDDELGYCNMRSPTVAMDFTQHPPVILDSKANTTKRHLGQRNVMSGRVRTIKKNRRKQTNRNKILRTCEICNGKFTTQSNLNRHKRCHQRNFLRIPCSVDGCDKTFASDDARKDHVRYIHEKVRVVCKFCKVEFANRGTLYKHIQRKHEGQALD